MPRSQCTPHREHRNVSRHIPRTTVYAILQLYVPARISLSEPRQGVASAIETSLPFDFVNLRRRPIGLGAVIENHAKNGAFTQGLWEMPSDNLDSSPVIADQHCDGTLYSINCKEGHHASKHLRRRIACAARRPVTLIATADTRVTACLSAPTDPAARTRWLPRDRRVTRGVSGGYVSR